jgi:hypothetical protein
MEARHKRAVLTIARVATCFQMVERLRRRVVVSGKSGLPMREVDVLSLGGDRHLLFVSFEYGMFLLYSYS